MSKKSRFRQPYKKWHGKQAETLFKAEPKGLSEWYAKSSDCLLTHWLPITSILFIIETIYTNMLICIYLKKKKISSNSLLHFWNLDFILNILKKELTLIADVFLNLRTPKNVVR